MITRFFIDAAITIVVSALLIGAAASPAHAVVSSTMCTETPGQLRAATSTAPIADQQRAALLITTGQHLCDLRVSEAAKKFAAAARALNLDLDALPGSAVSVR